MNSTAQAKSTQPPTTNFPQLVKDLYPMFSNVKKMIMQNSGSESDAEDIFHDGLVAVCRSNKISCLTEKEIKNYFYGIVKNLWLTELRKRKKTQVMPEGDPIEQDYDENRYQLAQQAFAGLGEKCKELLTLFYFKKLDYEKIAAELGFSDGRVAKNQKYRCIQKAKEHYLLLVKQQTT